MDSSKQEVERDVFPYLRVHRDGTIERLVGTETVPPSFDSPTGVSSEDIIIVKETGLCARLYLPTLTTDDKKLPLIVYFHGGGFFISSVSDPKYHHSLNSMAAASKALIVSVDFRIAPENPLPAAYEDAWAVIQGLASYKRGEVDNCPDDWIRAHVDFNRVYLAGDSAGANMAHHMAMRIGLKDPLPDFKILGIISIHPYFWGKEPIGLEVTDPDRKAMVDNWWLFVCPTDKGCDDPLINPFADGCPGLESLACERVLVLVAGKDILRDRGKLYYERLMKSGWPGKVEIIETEGEDHVFHIFQPNCEKAQNFMKHIAAFVNQP